MRQEKPFFSIIVPTHNRPRQMEACLESLKKHYQQFRADLGDANLRGMLPLAKALQEFFRERITLEQADEEIKRMLNRREERFLELVRTHVYERPDSPYLKLLKLAGCDFADLKVHVHRDGLEGTLEG